jgi:hypothetical protein
MGSSLTAALSPTMAVQVLRLIRGGVGFRYGQRTLGQHDRRPEGFIPRAKRTSDWLQVPREEVQRKRWFVTVEKTVQVVPRASAVTWSHGRAGPA